MPPFNEARMIWARINKTTSPIGCWLWTGYIDEDGYGRVRVTHLGEELAHRVVYSIVKGPIPAGLDLDHACRVHDCVNPDHLEPVTRRVNTMRGIGPSAIHARQTRCVNGHPFDDTNTLVTTSSRGTQRSCRTCNRAAAARYRARREVVLR